RVGRLGRELRSGAKPVQRWKIVEYEFGLARLERQQLPQKELVVQLIGDRIPQPSVQSVPSPDRIGGMLKQAAVPVKRGRERSRAGRSRSPKRRPHEGSNGAFGRELHAIDGGQDLAERQEGGVVERHASFASGRASGCGRRPSNDDVAQRRVPPPSLQ